MPRELEPSLNTRNFTLAALQNELRLDSRSLTQTRQLQLSFGDNLGSAYVQLGNTKYTYPPIEKTHVPLIEKRVMAQVSASVVKPYDDSPFEGIFALSTEFSPMASSSFEAARGGPSELLLSRTLDNVLRRARAIDLESLCILAKKLVWSIRVDVHFLDHDGGLVDAACVAVIAALSAFRREDVQVRGDQVEIVLCSFL
jgi:exosome complex component RRP45